MKKLFKRTVLLFSLFLVVGFLLPRLQIRVFAEQSGSSPESGATSRIKTIYNSLVALSHGSESAGGWGDWGVLWNRIRSAAEWVPSGNAAEADVASGKLFYKDSRTQKTGTASLAPDYSLQSKVTWDDNKNSSNSDGDNAGEESVWVNTAGSASTGVWKDGRTGLYWSPNQWTMSNLFTVATCDFFTSNSRGGYAGGDSDCGNAINHCANLNLTSGGTSNTDWYLPSQKELIQAYLDGIYNQTNINFATNLRFWSSTEDSAIDSNAWNVYFYNGSTGLGSKSTTSNQSVRCVRRD
ncbi:DUF1566 domain-containing protein [Candidatus Woesebacteria bacterium]|nr:DUF1566 domain-containing protein [Candidatus Woesebacteria bacterium]